MNTNTTDRLHFVAAELHKASTLANGTTSVPVRCEHCGWTHDAVVPTVADRTKLALAVADAAARMNDLHNATRKADR